MTHTTPQDPDEHPTLDLEALARVAARTSGLFPDDEALAPHLDVSSRAAYRTWVTAWKAAYREVADHIRGLKAELARPHHQLENVGALMVRRRRARALARALLALRALGKQESGRVQQAGMQETVS